MLKLHIKYISHSVLKIKIQVKKLTGMIVDYISICLRFSYRHLYDALFRKIFPEDKYKNLFIHWNREDVEYHCVWERYVCAGHHYFTARFFGRLLLIVVLDIGNHSSLGFCRGLVWGHSLLYSHSIVQIYNSNQWMVNKREFLKWFG